MNFLPSNAVAGLLCAALSLTPLMAQPETELPVPESSSQRWELDAENLHASDINLLSSSLLGRFSTGVVEWSSITGYNRLDVDYQPVSSADVIGQPNNLSESNQSGQIQASLSTSASTEYWLSAGFYEGFTNHNSLWLDEYYRQQFSRFEGYLPSSPQGQNIGTGWVHDFGKWPGVLGVAISYGQDDVAPGYDRPLFQALERGRERLYTSGLTLSIESVPFNHVRVRHELNLNDVSDRDLRLSYRGSLNRPDRNLGGSGRGNLHRGGLA